MSGPKGEKVSACPASRMSDNIIIYNIIIYNIIIYDIIITIYLWSSLCPLAGNFHADLMVLFSGTLNGIVLYASVSQYVPSRTD